MTPSRRFGLGPDRSGKTVERYIAVYMDRLEGAEMSFEAKSDRAAFRIAASYEVERRRGFDFRACTLVGLLKFTDGYYWRGLDRALIERYSPFRRRCAGCLQRKPKAWMTDIDGEFFCRLCLAGHAVLSVAELIPPSMPLIEAPNEICR